MKLEEAMKMICDHRAKVKRTKDDWHDGYYDGFTAALMMLSEDKPADTDKPIWEAKDKMTLKELAHEMRKIFKFDYLTCEGCGDLRDYIIWLDKPEYIGDGWTRYSISDVLLLFESCRLAIQIDLSEYADENGDIDYSRCIVEVTDDIE